MLTESFSTCSDTDIVRGVFQTARNCHHGSVASSRCRRRTCLATLMRSVCDQRGTSPCCDQTYPACSPSWRSHPNSSTMLMMHAIGKHKCWAPRFSLNPICGLTFNDFFSFAFCTLHHSCQWFIFVIISHFPFRPNMSVFVHFSYIQCTKYWAKTDVQVYLICLFKCYFYYDN